MRGLKGVIEDIFLYDLTFVYDHFGPDPRSRVDYRPVLKYASRTDYGIVLDTAKKTYLCVIIDDTARDCALTAYLDMVVYG